MNKSKKEQKIYEKSFLQKEFDETFSTLFDEFIGATVFSGLSILSVALAPITMIFGLIAFTQDEILPKIIYFIAGSTFLISAFTLIIGIIFYFIFERGKDKVRSEKFFSIAIWSSTISSLFGFWVMFYIFHVIREFFS